MDLSRKLGVSEGSSVTYLHYQHSVIERSLIGIIAGSRRLIASGTTLDLASKTLA